MIAIRIVMMMAQWWRRWPWWWWHNWWRRRCDAIAILWWWWRQVLNDDMIAIVIAITIEIVMMLLMMMAQWWRRLRCELKMTMQSQSQSWSLYYNRRVGVLRLFKVNNMHFWSKSDFGILSHKYVLPHRYLLRHRVRFTSMFPMTQSKIQDSLPCCSLRLMSSKIKRTPSQIFFHHTYIAAPIPSEWKKIFEKDFILCVAKLDVHLQEQQFVCYQPNPQSIVEALMSAETTTLIGFF